MKPGTPIVIANPAAAGGKVGKSLHAIHQALSRRFPAYEILETHSQDMPRNWRRKPWRGADGPCFP